MQIQIKLEMSKRWSQLDIRDMDLTPQTKQVPIKSVNMDDKLLMVTL